MAKINKIEKSSTYLTIRDGSVAAKNERGDCTVVATSVVTGWDYDFAHAMCEKHGRNNRSGWYEWSMVDMLRRNGFEVKEMSSYYDFITKYPGAHSELRNVTTHHPDRFNDIWADGHKYLLFQRRHVSAVDNGVLHDWARGSARRVVSIYRVTKI